VNLAVHDAFLLGDALAAYVTRGNDSGLGGCSTACLRAGVG
jgi:p-hydroxybenzoate 3-monooxygenase